MPRQPHPSAPPAVLLRSVLLKILLLPALLLTACGGTPDPEPTPEDSTSHTPTAPGDGPAPAPVPVRVGAEVADGLRVPWGISYLADGSALVTERDTQRLLHLTRAGRGWRTRQVATIDSSPGVGPSLEGGLLGIATQTDGRADGLTRVFLYLTTTEDNRILRADFDGERLSEPTPILTGIPRADYHDGGRIAFGPDGHLYASTGDAGQPDLAQDPRSLAGKILRMDRRGRPVADNPDPASVVYSLGHRNVQGLAWDDAGQLWASEFGEQTWDELNRIEAGGNYGWPLLEGRAQDNGDSGDSGGFIDPVTVWSTDQASPSGLAWAGGALWLGALRGTRLWQVRVDADDQATSTPHFVGEYGRLRTVVTTPGGDLWVTTSNHDGRGQPTSTDDRILLVRP